jgi:hypothetical protein
MVVRAEELWWVTIQLFNRSLGTLHTSRGGIDTHHPIQFVTASLRLTSLHLPFFHPSFLPSSAPILKCLMWMGLGHKRARTSL